MTYRNGVPVRTIDHVSFILSHCALGDAISSLPAICWARKTNTMDIRMTVWAPEHQIELFEYLVGGPGLRFMPLDQFKTKVSTGDEDLAGPCIINAVYKDTITRNKIDLVDYAFMCMLDKPPTCESDRNYPHWAPLRERPLTAPYVVLAPGGTNKASLMSVSLLTGILDYLLDKGIVPVILGKPGESHVKTIGSTKNLMVEDHFDELPEHLRDRCVDMRGKTTLLEARDWLGHAAAVVGIDGGLLHLAGTTDVPIVYGCTRVAPTVRGITRHGERNWNLVHVLPDNLECSGCQTNWTLMFNHDFRNCAYEDFLCADQLHADDFISALKLFGIQ